MAEIENKANSNFGGGDYPRVGWPDYQGRIANRALEELLTLDSNDESRPDRSLLTVGDLDQNMADMIKKNWLRDSEIRSQFHEFPGETSFHEGTYLLSQDRVDVMMSGAEGSEGPYFQKPEINEPNRDRLSLEQLDQLIRTQGEYLRLKPQDEFTSYAFSSAGANSNNPGVTRRNPHAALEALR